MFSGPVIFLYFKKIFAVYKVDRLMAKIVFRLMAKMFLCRLVLGLGDGKVFAVFQMKS